MTSSRFNWLDGVRGVAALFILNRHTNEFWGFQFYRSYLAVDLFFVLSGFVIAHAYDEKLVSGRMNLKLFAVTRLLRLYPVYALSIVLGALAACLSYPPPTQTTA